ncbi:hypothetical protein NCCP2165_15610 [Halomonas sp. NCCP-2165]|nr:hypothetical protein NCCP2165_15610 [Halomonas sp. NCCP-2165]
MRHQQRADAFPAGFRRDKPPLDIALMDTAEAQYLALVTPGTPQLDGIEILIEDKRLELLQVFLRQEVVCGPDRSLLDSYQR